MKTSDSPYRRSRRPGRGWSVAAMVVTALLSLSSIASAQKPSAAALLFEKSCYSCHGIGGGTKLGPDLKGVTERRRTEWLHEFISSPAAMKRKGDPAAVELFSRYSPNIMPDQPLAADQIDGLLAFIEEASSASGAWVPAGAKLPRAITKTDADEGYRLFTGETALTAGGASCISCHTLQSIGGFGGGTLGPDLTAANLRYRDPELIGILQNPSFPTMAGQFANHPLTSEELVKLFALLQRESAALAHSPLPGGASVAAIESRFILGGGVTLVLGLVGMNFIWRRRLNGVREQLVRRKRS